MRVVLAKELDIELLYDDITDSFEEFNACEEIGMQHDDINPKLMTVIFTALAKEASRRASDE